MNQTAQESFLMVTEGQMAEEEVATSEKKKPTLPLPKVTFSWWYYLATQRVFKRAYYVLYQKRDYYNSSFSSKC